MISNDRVLGVNLPIGIQLGHHISMPFPCNLTTCFVVLQMENSALGRLSVAFDSPFKARNLEDLSVSQFFHALHGEFSRAAGAHEGTGHLMSFMPLQSPTLVQEQNALYTESRWSKHDAASLVNESLGSVVFLVRWHAQVFVCPWRQGHLFQSTWPLTRIRYPLKSYGSVPDNRIMNHAKSERSQVGLAIAWLQFSNSYVLGCPHARPCQTAQAATVAAELRASMLLAHVNTSTCKYNTMYDMFIIS